jgi:hypothetical protein
MCAEHKVLPHTTLFPTTPSFPRRRESKRSIKQTLATADTAQGPSSTNQQISSHKSRQARFRSSISRTFHARFHFFKLFSRAIAACIVSCISYQTNRFTPKRSVNPSATPSRCCQTRCTRFDVTPIYSVPCIPEAIIYTAGNLIPRHPCQQNPILPPTPSRRPESPHRMKVNQYSRAHANPSVLLSRPNTTAHNTGPLAAPAQAISCSAGLNND